MPKHWETMPALPGNAEVHEPYDDYGSKPMKAKVCNELLVTIWYLALITDSYINLKFLWMLFRPSPIEPRIMYVLNMISLTMGYYLVASIIQFMTMKCYSHYMWSWIYKTTSWQELTLWFWINKSLVDFVTVLMTANKDPFDFSKLWKFILVETEKNLTQCQ